MNWQGIVLAVGQVVFIIALVPSIMTKDKPEIWTSILTGTVALSISITYMTLSLKAAAISAFFNFVAWGILAIQKMHQIKAVKHMNTKGQTNRK